MLLHEDLWIKISEDFHAEINPILEQLNSTSKKNYWFDQKSIPHKFHIIKNVLLALNGQELNISQLTKLLNILKTYEIRVRTYLESHDFATCFVYFTFERNASPKDYFNKISKYSISFSRHDLTPKVCTLYKIGMGIIGFPNTCSYKLTAKISDNKIFIEKNDSPIHSNEIEKGKQMCNSKRSRKEQFEIENQLSRQNFELMKKRKIWASQEFTEFAEKTHKKNNALLADFDSCKVLCKSIIDKQQKDTINVRLPGIEKIYLVLKNGYIPESFDHFASIFQPEYSGEKITWLKSGAELKFLLDKVIAKLFNVNNINQWGDSRFKLNGITNLTSYLGTVRHKNSYYNRLESGLDRQNQIYKLSKEF